MDDLINSLINKYWTSSDLKKAVTQIKKTEGSIKKQRTNLDKYLSEDEREELIKAENVLDRFTGKMEKAFKEKAHRELEEKYRREKRFSECMALVKTNDSYEGQIKDYIILSKMLNTYEFKAGKIKSELDEEERLKASRQWETNLDLWAKNFIEEQHKKIVKYLCDRYAYDTLSFDDFKERFLSQYNELLNSCSSEIEDITSFVKSYRVKHQLIEANKNSSDKD